MISNEVIKKLKEICNNSTNKDEFKRLAARNSFMLTKRQEKFFIEKSDGMFTRLKHTDAGKNYDKEINRDYGDFTDENGNYYDLHVGRTDNAGSITKNSLLSFGSTDTNKHWYICVNHNLSKLYIINARELLEMKDEFDWYTNGREQFIGEKHFVDRFESYI